MLSDLETRPSYHCGAKNSLARWLAKDCFFTARVIPQLGLLCGIMYEKKKGFSAELRQVDHPILKTKCHMKPPTIVESYHSIVLDILLMRRCQLRWMEAGSSAQWVGTVSVPSPRSCGKSCKPWPAEPNSSRGHGREGVPLGRSRLACDQAYGPRAGRALDPP